jgi:hypothetical protein
MTKMLDKLDAVIAQLPSLLSDFSIWDSIVVNLKKPHTYRVFTYLQNGDRVSLHKFEKCDSSEAFSHPHPWPGAFKILKGSYEMPIEYSCMGRVDCSPVAVSTFRLTAGSSYEIMNPYTWHSITPLEDTFTVMVNESPWHPDFKHMLCPTTDGKNLSKMGQEDLEQHIIDFRWLMFCSGK